MIKQFVDRFGANPKSGVTLNSIKALFVEEIQAELIMAMSAGWGTLSAHPVRNRAISAILLMPKIILLK